MIKVPLLAEQIVQSLETNSASGTLVEAYAIRNDFIVDGAEIPTWRDLKDGAEPPPRAEGSDATEFNSG